MKTNFKRLFALLLTLCMLASLMVPVAFAEDEAVETPAAITVATYPIRVKDLTVNDANDSVPGTLDYLMTKNSDNPYTNEAGEYVDKEGNVVEKPVYPKVWNPTANAYALTNAYDEGVLNAVYFIGKGNNISFRSELMFQLRFKKDSDVEDQFVAVKMRVAQDGIFSLNIKSDKSEPLMTKDEATAAGKQFYMSDNDWAGDFTAHIIPLADYEAKIADGTAAKDAIISLKNSGEYSVGTASMAADQEVVTFDKTRMYEGEYLVVYEASKSNSYISEMSLTTTAEDAAQFELETVKTYPIRPIDMTQTDSATATNDYNKWFINASKAYKSMELDDLLSKLNAAYADLGWGYLASESAASSQIWRLDQMLQLRHVKNKWMALKINVPQSGAYSLSMSTDRTEDFENTDSKWSNCSFNSDGSFKADNSKKAGNFTAYIIPLADYNAAVENAVIPEGQTTTAEAIAVSTLMTEANSVGTYYLAADESKVVFDRKYMEAGEYAVIYKIAIDAMGICEMALEQRICDRAPAKTEGYTFEQEISMELYNIDDPVFNQISGENTTFATELKDGNGGTTTLEAYVAALYAEGKLDWKIEAYPSTFTAANFVSEEAHERGMEVKTPNDSDKTTDWVAIRFRVDKADFYSITPNCKMITTPGVRTYMFPAAEEAMTAEQIAAQIIPENGLFIQGMNLDAEAVSVGYLDGEYIMVYSAPYGRNRTFNVMSILLESEATLSADDVQTYDFNIFNENNPYYTYLTNPNLYKRWSEKVNQEVVDETTGETTTKEVTVYHYDHVVGTELASINLRDYFIATQFDAENNPTEYKALWRYVFNEVSLEGYRYNLNWRPDRARNSTKTNSGTDAAMDFYRFYNVDADADSVEAYMKATIKNTKTETTFSSVMIHVDKAGTYKLSAKGGFYGFTADVFFIDAFDNSGAVVSDEYILGYVEAENPTTLVKSEFKIPERTKGYGEIGEVTVDAAGDYLVVFVDKVHGHLDGLMLTPVVEEYGAGVAGETYATFGEALAVAEAGDTITLMDGVLAGEITVPAGVTLELNGQSVKANSIDAINPGAKIIDCTNGGGALYADEVIFNESNPQLPLNDKLTGAYYLFDVSIVPVTVTGKNSATPKYWFQIQFTNNKAAELIAEYGQMTINAGLTVDGTVGEANADTAFSKAWAEKYVANNGIYITLSMDATGIASIDLAPYVSACGVEIAGGATAIQREVAPAEPEVAA